MRVADFYFDLPEELIAQHPPAERGASRMLVMQREGGALRDAWFRDLPEFLRPGDLLVLNDSRVIPARLFARRAAQNASEGSHEPSGEIEVLLTEQVKNEHANLWRALVKPGRKVRVGQRLEFFDSQGEASSSHPSEGRDAGHTPVLTAEVIATGERGERTLRFAPVRGSSADFNDVLARIGHMPLPPYIRQGHDEPQDRERYQTVYAHEPGSAAAPTAGLHFTPEILEALRARGVEIAYLTLHVGLGTFQPVRVEKVEDIRLHAERYTLPATTADALKRALHGSEKEARRVIAVGTTTTRTLEHIARAAGAGLPSSSTLPNLNLSVPPGMGRAGGSEGRGSGDWIDRILPHSGETAIFIAPGDRFRIVSGLLTNFHLPQSTLLMLVSAFAGDRTARSCSPEETDSGRSAVLAAYAHAVRERYRFYSYGDCMLVL